MTIGVSPAECQAAANHLSRITGLQWHADVEDPPCIFLQPHLLLSEQVQQVSLKLAELKLPESALETMDTGGPHPSVFRGIEFLSSSVSDASTIKALSKAENAQRRKTMLCLAIAVASVGAPLCSLVALMAKSGAFSVQ